MGFGLLFLVGLAFVVCAASSLLYRDRIDKCCGSEDVLVLNDTGYLQCVQTAEGHQVQALPDIRHDEDTKGVLPKCNKSSYLELWEYYNEADDSANDDDNSNACLDVFFDEKSHQDFPVVIRCSPIAIEMTEPVPSQPAPQLLNLRKCCPDDGYYYDFDKKFCVKRTEVLFGRWNLSGIDFINAQRGPPTCEHALVDFRVPLNNVYYTSTDTMVKWALYPPFEGSLRTLNKCNFQIAIPGNGYGRRNVTVDETSACLDVDASPDHIVARICRGLDYCKANPCVRKCCLNSKVDDTMCMDNFDTGNIENFRTSVARAVERSNATPARDTQNYGLLFGKPCKNMYAVTEEEVWEIGPMGEILVRNPVTQIYGHANSCLEFFNSNGTFIDAGLQPFVCFEYDDHRDRSYAVTTTLQLISCFFALATLLVYMWLPSLQNLHGKTIMCHVASLFFAYACLAFITITTNNILDDLNSELADISCLYLGYVMLFWFYATFLWLNVMCFDIWWTFGGLHRAANPTSKRAQQRNRFLIYCLYSWGVSLLLTGLTVAVDRLGLLPSNFGRERCWFDKSTVLEVVVFITPVSITLLVNTALFTTTARRCSKVKAEIKRVTANERDPKARRFHSDRTRLIMNFKLFIVMGIPWLLDNATSYPNHYNMMPWWLNQVAFASDVVNSLQGLWIFILLVLKPKVYRALQKRFGNPQNKRGNMTLTVTTSNPRKSLSSSSTLNFRLSSSS
ncbi:G-protein coupled receptor Mth2-like isoform X2 [Copidosoma floridanum]|uniref:G-protein coupled receptor Mth2-like isoform X2 n=1 Tax=Copidosoma floridanum TaxID=29053 RepID=UPI000C6F846E|nr:G-protein coupled receptor Mth2-like isoform X2 [Copidosoma floridanum]